MLVAFAERSRHGVGFVVARHEEWLAGERIARAGFAAGVSGVRNRCWRLASGVLAVVLVVARIRGGAVLRAGVRNHGWRLASRVRAVVRAVAGFTAGGVRVVGLRLAALRVGFGR